MTNAGRTNAKVRKKAVWGGRATMGALLFVAVVAAMLLAGCSQLRQSQSSSYLVITSLQGGAGTNGSFGSVLESDVISDTGSIAADRGQANFTLQMKDVNGLGPTENNSITLTQYHVEYVRSDGRNVQGIDVPYAFDGAVTATVSNTASVGFTLVRIQAKLEPPLTALVHQGGAQAITTIAKVTFYGHDQTGRDVSVSGNIEVDFADWAG
jgi:hypothetical protein